MSDETCACGCGQFPGLAPKTITSRGWIKGQPKRYVKGHNGGSRLSLQERFWSRVNKTDACWLWTGTINPSGYGAISVQNRTRPAHRVAYEWLVGPIPTGLELDHLCRVRHCVNPEHLEPVTHRVNQLRGFGFSGIHARKTECIRGHEFTEENTEHRRSGSRGCRECRRVRRMAARSAAKPADVPARSEVDE